jgi:hypothetical protein
MGAIFVDTWKNIMQTTYDFSRSLLFCFLLNFQVSFSKLINRVVIVIFASSFSPLFVHLYRLIIKEKKMNECALSASKGVFKKKKCKYNLFLSNFCAYSKQTSCF